MMRQSSIGRFHGIARRTQNNEDTPSMAATSTASPVSFHSLATEGWFYVSMAVFSLFFCIAAFGPSIVYTERRLGTITPLVAVHGIAFFAWLLLFIVQAMLARTRNLALHRRLGMWSATLATALVVLGYQTTIAMAHRSYDMAVMSESAPIHLPRWPFRFWTSSCSLPCFWPRTCIGIVALSTSASCYWQ